MLLIGLSCVSRAWDCEAGNLFLLMMAPLYLSFTVDFDFVTMVHSVMRSVQQKRDSSIYKLQVERCVAPHEVVACLGKNYMPALLLSSPKRSLCLWAITGIHRGPSP